MLRFKQFLIEGVVDQVKTAERRAKLLAPDLVKNNRSINFSFGGTDVAAFVNPEDTNRYGSYSFFEKGADLGDGFKNPDDFHRIKIFTNNCVYI